MSKKRLVEYVVVAGVKKNQAPSTAARTETSGAEYLSSPLSPLSPLSEHVSRVDDIVLGPALPPDVKVNAAIKQRFPVENRAESALPSGLEIFCQPLGWYLTFSPKPPSFIDFILTAEDSSRLYCTALNFYQLARQKKPTKRHSDPAPSCLATQGGEKDKHKRKVSKLQFLDEADEENLLVQDAYGDMYQPVSLVLVSKQPLFELLQLLLKSLYISWLSGGSQKPGRLESLVAEILTDLYIPQVNCLPVKKPFGPLKEFVLPPIHEEMGAPYTSTAAWWLLRRIGVHQLIQLVSAVLCDTSVLIVSSSYTVVTTALKALVAIVHPFNVSHSLVPVLPLELLEYTQLPSTYIMGVHTLIREQLEDELLDVVEVYLDQGRIIIPDTINLPFFPEPIISLVNNALIDILEPNFHARDHAFCSVKDSPEWEEYCGRASREEFLDKKVRAVFLSLMTVLLGDFQKFITVLRFNPSPGFYFNMDAYLTSREDGTNHQSIFNKMAMSIAFYNFCYEHSVPFRHCDFYDELVARQASNPQDFLPEKLFTRESIVDMAEELLNYMPSCYPGGGPEFSLEGVQQEVMECPGERFPRLDDNLVTEKMTEFRENGQNNEEEEEEGTAMVTTTSFKRMIPLLEGTPTHRHKSVEYARGVDTLVNCLDAMFQSKIIEARKYVPSLIQSLKSGILSDILMPALVDRFWQYGVLLTSEQFDLVVKLLNSALVDEKSAMTLLPLMTVIYREVNLGVQQYACTCVQNHSIWGKVDFWRDAIYMAIQAELVRIYAEVESEYRKKEREQQRENKDANELSPEPVEDGDITLRSRVRIRSSSPTRVRATLRASKVALSRSAKVRMRMSVVVPGLSEGMLPPNAQPVTCQEALHHLAKTLDIWDKLPPEKQETLIKMEDNAATNQVILFVQRVIHLRIPVELPESEEERAELVSELEQFIGRLLHMVEVDVTVDLTKQGKIIDQVHDMILIHLESMSGLRKELRRVPVSKPKVVKPPLIGGEEFLMDQGTHAYLIQDGRDNGCMLPADGQVFLTTYRIIFLGTPCSPQAPSLIVTRSMPIGSVYRLKKLGPVVLPHPVSITTTGGLQLRSVTAELMKIGFDDETSVADINNLEQQLIQLRNPASITLGLKFPSSGGTMDSDINLYSGPNFGQKKVSGWRESKKYPSSSNSPADLTRVKILSDISQSPYCREYERLQLGRVQFQASEKGLWRTSTINLCYPACSSYPSVLVVPSKVSDEHLVALAGQFQLNRFPVVTWRHPRKEVVLLRSSSFVPSVIGKKKFSGHAVLPQALKQAASNKHAQNRAGVGVYNAEFENYLYNLVQNSPTSRQSLHQTQHLAFLPPTMEFDEEELRRQNSFRGPPSPTPSRESLELLEQQDPSKGLGPRARAQTIGFTIRKRVGSSVSQFSRVVLANKGSPSSHKKLSTRRKGFSSPHLPRKPPISEDAISRNSTCSSASDLSVEKARQSDSLKEEPELEENEKIEILKNTEVSKKTDESEETEDVSEKAGDVSEKAEDVSEKTEDVSEKIDVSEETEDVSEKTDVYEETENVSEKTEDVSEKTDVSGKTEGVPDKTEEVPVRDNDSQTSDACSLKKESEKTRISVEAESGELCKISSPWEKKDAPEVSNRSEVAAVNGSKKAKAPSTKADIFDGDTGKFEGRKSTSHLEPVKKSSHKRTRSSDQVIELDAADIHLADIEVALKANSSVTPMSPIEWETLEQVDKPLSPRLESASTPDNSERNSSPELLDSMSLARKYSSKVDKLGALRRGAKVDPHQTTGGFSTLPTNPRDWVVMDMLPGELGHWQSSAVYIVGDRSVLQDIPEDLYPSCTFVPVETPSQTDVSNSFKKLMRACIPSAPQASYLSAVQESGWGTQLAQLMQLGGAVADLIDIQSSSVLVCMENGWDATAQVVSIAQVLLDPYYRTIEGFSLLIEKDWLSFGHRFSHNGSHTSATPMTSFTPIFLQFLDIIHQILRQFPLSFEFNDFYLRTLAYHHSSMRFHTFTADSEKERYTNNWLGYRPRMANLHGNSVKAEPHQSIWDYINSLHRDSMIFYNFQYNLSDSNFDLPPLRPHSYQANLDVWSYYLDNHLSQFPPYDTELLSESPLTLLDMHHNFFEKEKLALMGVGGDHPGSTFSEVTSLLWQYTKMMNAIAERSKNLPQVSWMELLNELVASSQDISISRPVYQANSLVLTHSQTLHKRTTLAVLLKGKLAAELESQFTTPHQFEAIERGRKQYECSFCKNKISRNLDDRVVKCKRCGRACHTHCSILMPNNCGQEKILGRRRSKKKPSPREPVEGSNWNRQGGSVFFDNQNMLDGANLINEGYLYKKGKIVRNWKLRWFMMDTEKGEINYYESNNLDRHCGTIRLSDVTSVVEAESQAVPSLKAVEGSFFNLVTQKRVFSLMAQRDAERSGWMALIQAAITAPRAS